MRVTLAAVGRARSEPEAQLFLDYWKRAAVLGPRLGFTGFHVHAIDVSRRASPEARRQEEVASLVRRMPAGARRIALHEGGRSLRSDVFANQLCAFRDDGAPDVVFVIGGPDGLSAD